MAHTHMATSHGSLLILNIISLISRCGDILGVPGPPTLLEAKDITPTSASISWKAPADDGGSTITNYLVEKKQSPGNRWARVNK